jgi:hypothetical protein
VAAAALVVEAQHVSSPVNDDAMWLESKGY